MTSSDHEPLGRNELQQRAVKGALWTAIHIAVSLPLAFLVNIIVARVLGVSDYGRLAFLTTVITIASVLAGLGVSTALIQFGAKAHAVGNHAEVRRLLSGSQGFRLLFSGPVIAVAVLAIVRVDWWLLVIALAFGVGIPAVLGNARPALTIENRTDRTAQLTMVGSFVTQTVVVVTVLTLGTPDAVWSARIIAAGLLLALPLLAISHQYRAAVLRPSSPWRLPRSFWAFAIPTGMAGLIGALVMDRTELILLQWFGDEHAMGLFGLAFGLAGHVYAPAQAFIGPLVPAVSALSAVDTSSLQRAFIRTTRAGSAIGGLLVAAALPTLAYLVPLIYGHDFIGARDLLMIVGIGGAVMLVGSPHQAFLMGRLGGARLLRINVVALVLNVVTALLLIPHFGALGAAIACAATFGTRAALLTTGEARALNLSIRQVASSSMAMIIAIVIALCLWLVARRFTEVGIVYAVALSAVGLATYVMLLKVTRTGLSTQDSSAIAQAVPPRMRGGATALLWLLASARAAP